MVTEDLGLPLASVKVRELSIPAARMVLYR